MKRCVLVLCVIVLSLNPVFPVPQQDLSNVQIKTTRVAGNVYMLEGAGGNIGVSVGPDGILIIDDQFAPLAEKIRAALAGISPGKLKFILNTHWHGDHTGSNRVFGSEASIIAHTNVRKRLMTEQQRPDKVTPAEPKQAWPVITFDESLTIHFNDDDIRVLHYPPGHTDGDAIIFFPRANVVHMGDHYFARGFPFIDLNSGGDVAGFVKNVGDVVEKLPADVKIIPGHGPLSTIENLKSYHKMLVETTSLIRKKMDTGKSLDTLKTEGLPDEWQSWGKSYISTDRWIEMVYQSFSKNKDTGSPQHR